MATALARPAHRLSLGKVLQKGVLPLALVAGAALIAIGSVVYFSEEAPPFLLEKLPLPNEDLWLLAVRVHVVTAIFSLVACLVLRSAMVVRRAPILHRWLGRVTGIALLLGAVPSGFYLALFAKGGLPSTIGFLLSGVITALAMVEAIRRARRGEVAAHRRAANHVLAQLSVAVTSRTLLLCFDTFGYDPTTSYLISLWVPVIGSALLVEIGACRRVCAYLFRTLSQLLWRSHAPHRGNAVAVDKLAGSGVTAR